MVFVRIIMILLNDPTKWLIKLFSYIGLTYNLKRVSQDQIIRYRLNMKQCLNQTK